MTHSSHPAPPPPPPRHSFPRPHFLRLLESPVAPNRPSHLPHLNCREISETADGCSLPSLRSSILHSLSVQNLTWSLPPTSQHHSAHAARTTVPGAAPTCGVWISAPGHSVCALHACIPTSTPLTSFVGGTCGASSAWSAHATGTQYAHHTVRMCEVGGRI
jgi:hypothetical protein